MTQNVKNLTFQCPIDIKARITTCPVAMYCTEHYILFSETRSRKFMDFFYNITIKEATPATAARLQDICKNCPARPTKECARIAEDVKQKKQQFQNIRVR